MLKGNTVCKPVCIMMAFTLRGLGRLRSIQGLPSIKPHGMVETPHGIDFSVSFPFIMMAFTSQGRLFACIRQIGWIAQRVLPLHGSTRLLYSLHTVPKDIIVREPVSIMMPFTSQGRLCVCIRVFGQEGKSQTGVATELEELRQVPA